MLMLLHLSCSSTAHTQSLYWCCSLLLLARLIQSRDIVHHWVNGYYVSCVSDDGVDFSNRFNQQIKADSIKWAPKQVHTYSGDQAHMRVPYGDRRTTQTCCSVLSFRFLNFIIFLLFFFSFPFSRFWFLILFVFFVVVDFKIEPVQRVVELACS